MLDELLLISGNQIPFVGAQITIHPPTIKEIGMIGEREFHIGARFLNVSKDLLVIEDKSGLENQSNFDIFIAILNSNQLKEYKVDAFKVLTLMFPNIEFKIEKDKILLLQENIEKSQINNSNFEELQQIVREMFCLRTTAEQSYNPADGLAKKIAEKFKKRREKLAKMKGTEENEEGKIDLLSRYVSILAVGLKKDMNDLLNYTIYQLYDEFARFQLKQEFDIYLKAKMAGAQDLEEAENWMDRVHP